MTRSYRSTRPAALLFALAAPLALAACDSGEDVTLETDAEDVGGGEIQVRQPEEGEVDVTVPDTPMTPVPEGEDGPVMDDGAMDEGSGEDM